MACYYLQGDLSLWDLPQDEPTDNLTFNEWFSSNRRLSFAHRIMGSPGGKHCKLLQSIVWRGVVSPLKAVSFGHGMQHIAVILWVAEMTTVGALKLQVFVGSIRWTLTINSPSCKRSTVKFYTEWSRNIDIKELGMTHLSFSGCSYMCWYLQRVLLHSARRRSQRCAGLWQRSKVCLLNLIYICIDFKKQKHLPHIGILISPR